MGGGGQRQPPGGPRPQTCLEVTPFPRLPRAGTPGQKPHNATQVRHTTEILREEGSPHRFSPLPTDKLEEWADREHQLRDGWGPNRTIEPSERNDQRGGWPRCRGQRLEGGTDGKLGAQGRGRGSTLATWAKNAPDTRVDQGPGSRRGGCAGGQPPPARAIRSRAPHRVVELGDGRHDGVVVLAPVHLRAASPQLVPPVGRSWSLWGIGAEAPAAEEARAAAGNRRRWWWQRLRRLYVPRDSRRMWRLLGRPLGAPLCPVGRDWLADL